MRYNILSKNLFLIKISLLNTVFLTSVSKEKEPNFYQEKLKIAHKAIQEELCALEK